MNKVDIGLIDMLKSLVDIKNCIKLNIRRPGGIIVYLNYL